MVAASRVCLAPGKTFLLGEYYVTQAGEAYVIALEPSFHLEHEFSFQPALLNIHPDSPAGKFVKDHLDFFYQFKLTFVDPYYGMGGFGASTAQFLLVYQLYSAEKNLNLKSLLDYYLQYAWNGQGIIPSGADLLAQAVNHFCYINKEIFEIKKLDWPFPNLELHIVHTNHKTPTHSHLANLENLNTSRLKNIFQEAKNAFELSDAEKFCWAINDYQSELTAMGLVSNNTLKLLEKFNVQSEILAAKGCGAMGADTLLLITARGQTALINQLCGELNLVYTLMQSHFFI